MFFKQITFKRGYFFIVIVEIFRKSLFINKSGCRKEITIFFFGISYR